MRHRALAARKRWQCYRQARHLSGASSAVTMQPVFLIDLITAASSSGLIVCILISSTEMPFSASAFCSFYRQPHHMPAGKQRYICTFLPTPVPYLFQISDLLL